MIYNFIELINGLIDKTPPLGESKCAAVVQLLAGQTTVYAAANEQQISIQIDNNLRRINELDNNQGAVLYAEQNLEVGSRSQISSSMTSTYYCVKVDSKYSDDEASQIFIVFKSASQNLSDSDKRSIEVLAKYFSNFIDIPVLQGWPHRIEKSLNQFKFLVEAVQQSDNGIVVADNNGLVIWINRGFERLTGYTMVDLVDRKPGSLLQGQLTDQKTVAQIRSDLSKHRKFVAEIINYHHNGTPYWVRIHCTPLYSNSGELEGFLAIQLNIDKEKKQQEIIEDARELNNAVMSTLYDAVVTTDIKGQIKSVNQSFLNLFKYKESEVIGHPVSKLMPARIAKNHAKYMLAYENRNTKIAIMGSLRSVIALRSDGVEFLVRIMVSEISFKSEPYLVAAIQNISESEFSRISLKQFKATLDHTTDCVFIFDSTDLYFIYVNRGAVNQLGYTQDELLSMHPYDLKPEYNDHESFSELIRPLTDGTEISLRFTTIHRHKSGIDVPVEISLQLHSMEGTEESHYVAIVRDISEQIKQQEKIEHLAYYDPLTNLPNRRKTRQKLQEAIEISKIDGSYSAVLLTDLDDFKLINDTWGHRAGDDLLCSVSRELEAVTKFNGVVSRLGGDEFLVIMSNLPTNLELANDVVVKVAQSMLDAVENASHTLCLVRPITTSVGSIMFNDDSMCVSDLLRMADIAMYDAKGKGKNTASFFSHAMLEKVIAQEALISDLRVALNTTGQIVPWFQPKVDYNGRFIGFEALCRWNHPEKDLLSPIHFMGLAEDNGLIVPLGDQILDQSCRLMKSLQDQFDINDFMVSVNISQRQLAEPDFPKQVASALESSKLPPSSLRLEITESVVAEDIEQSIVVMEKIRLLGVTFSLDDFGTGYSSLSYLRRLPIDEVKIDKSFVENLLEDEEGLGLVESITLMAERLKLTVVAEGIESKEQWETLKSLNCRCFQGYLFSRPLPPHDVITAIERNLKEFP